MKSAGQNLNSPHSSLWSLWTHFFPPVAIPLMGSKTKAEETGSHLSWWLGSASKSRTSQRKDCSWSCCLTFNLNPRPRLCFDFSDTHSCPPRTYQRSTFDSKRLPRWQRRQCLPSSQAGLPPFNSKQTPGRVCCLAGSIISVQAEPSWGTACRTEKPSWDTSGPFLGSLAVPSQRLSCCALQAAFGGAFLVSLPTWRQSVP